MALNIGVWDFRHYSIGDVLKEMVEGTRDFYWKKRRSKRAPGSNNSII